MADSPTEFFKKRIHPNGKCEDCGFLGKHSLSHGPKHWYEIDKPERTDPSTYFYHRDQRGLATEPACFIGVFDLMAEITPKVTPPGNQESRDAVALAAITNERHCPGWYPYTTGFNPMEHYNFRRDERLEGERRDYEERTEESRRRYEEKMATDAETDRRRFDQANETRNRALIIASIIVGTIIGIAQIIAAVILNHESFTDQIMRRLFGH